MVGDDRFASRAETVEETPEPFRGALLGRLSPCESLRLLAFNPSQTSQDVRLPATLLALTDLRWLLVSDDEAARVVIVECAYNDTLLVELTEILLYGQLKIDFVAGGETRACAIEFNTVMDRLYRDAVHEILSAIEGEVVPAAAEVPVIITGIETWPMMFRNAISEAVPAGRRLAGAVQWPAIYDGFRRELAPAAALLVTDREIVFLSEERAWARGPRQAKHGHVATYFPLVRLAGGSLHRYGRLSTLELEMHATHGGETLRVFFPPGHHQDVSRVVETALRR